MRVKMNDLQLEQYFLKKIFTRKYSYYFFFYIAKSIFDFMGYPLFFNDSFPDINKV